MNSVKIDLENLTKDIEIPASSKLEIDLPLIDPRKNPKMFSPKQNNAILTKNPFLKKQFISDPNKCFKDKIRSHMTSEESRDKVEPVPIKVYDHDEFLNKVAKESADKSHFKFNPSPSDYMSMTEEEKLNFSKVIKNKRAVPKKLSPLIHRINSVQIIS
jgi:hypothetical protein